MSSQGGQGRGKRSPNPGSNNSGNKRKQNQGPRNSTEGNRPPARAFSMNNSNNAEAESEQKSSPVDEMKVRLKSNIQTYKSMQSGNASDSDKLSNSSVTSDSHSVDTKSGKFQCSSNSPENESIQRVSNDTKDCKETIEEQDKAENSGGESCVTEIEGDLFEAEDDVSLAHCVGADLRMGSGIAIRFYDKFQSVGKLFDQKIRPGGVAYLEFPHKCVFYLITKQASTDKPTEETMRNSLLSLHKKCKELGVTKLAMPQIGCGLDGLEWKDVKQMLEEIFADGFFITIYKLDSEFVNTRKPGPKSRVVNNKLMLKDIESGTGLLYIGHLQKPSNATEEMKSIDEKYPFISRLRNAPMKLGNAVYSNVPNNYTVYGLICKEHVDSALSYEHLEAAIGSIRSHNRKHGYDYFGLQAFEDKTDPFVMEKIATLFRNSGMKGVEFWICWPPALEHKCPSKLEQVNESIEAQGSSQICVKQEKSTSPNSSNSAKQSKEKKNKDYSKSKGKNKWDNDRGKAHNSQDQAVKEVEEKMVVQSLADESKSEITEMDTSNADEAKWDSEDGMARIGADIDTLQNIETHTSTIGEWTDDYAEDERRKSNEKKQANKLNAERERQEKKTVKPKSCVDECKGDLFDAEDTMCLAHCVGADFRMGSGIAVLFRQKFGCVPELLDQGVRQGGVAWIEHDKRYVFYLVTKTESTGKPTYGTLEKSLNALHDKCKELKVTELAMPRIGCGLDRLEWTEVRKMLERIFADGFSIKIYNLEKPAYGGNISGGGRNRSGGEMDSQRMASILRELQRSQELIYRKLMHFEDEREATVYNSSRNLQELSSKIDILIQKFHSFDESHESLRERVEALESTKQNYEERIVFLEQQFMNLTASEVDQTHANNINSYNYSPPGFRDHGPVPHLAAITAISHDRVVCNPQVSPHPGDYNNYRGIMHPVIDHPRFVGNSPVYASADQLPQEKQALMRQAEHFARANSYETKMRDGFISIRRNNREHYREIRNHEDLRSLQNSNV